MINTDDIPNGIVEQCKEYCEVPTDEDVWNESLRQGFRYDVIPNFSNIFLELLFGRVRYALPSTLKVKETYINNMDSYIDIGDAKE